MMFSIDDRCNTLTHTPPYSGKQTSLSRIKRLPLAILNSIKRFFSFFHKFFQNLKIEIQSAKNVFCKTPITQVSNLTNLNVQLEIDTNNELGRSERSLSNSSINETQPHTIISDRILNGPILSSNSQGNTFLNSNPCVPVLPSLEVPPSNNTFSSHNHQVAEIKNWFRSYREIGVNDQDIVDILQSEGFKNNDINSTLDLLSEEERNKRKPNALLESIVQETPSSLMESIVLATGDMNQYTINAPAACSMICRNYLETPNNKATPRSIGEILETCRNSSVYYIDTEECLMDSNTINIARSPWTHSLEPMTVDSKSTRYSLENAFFTLVDNRAIKGAIITGEGMSLAFKKLDDGMYEIFDPHGDYYMTRGRGSGAYVYRCRNINQVLTFFDRKFPIRNRNISQYFQLWPITRKN